MFTLNMCDFCCLIYSMIFPFPSMKVRVAPQSMMPFISEPSTKNSLVINLNESSCCWLRHETYSVVGAEAVPCESSTQFSLNFCFCEGIVGSSDPHHKCNRAVVELVHFDCCCRKNYGRLVRSVDNCCTLAAHCRTWVSRCDTLVVLFAGIDRLVDYGRTDGCL